MSSKHDERDGSGFTFHLPDITVGLVDEVEEVINDLQDAGKLTDNSLRKEILKIVNPTVRNPDGEVVKHRNLPRDVALSIALHINELVRIPLAPKWLGDSLAGSQEPEETTSEEMTDAQLRLAT